MRTSYFKVAGLVGQVKATTISRHERRGREYIDTARLVLIECEACRRKSPVDLSMLELTFGADFDMYSSMREMRTRLACPGLPAPCDQLLRPAPAPRGSELRRLGQSQPGVQRIQPSASGELDVKHRKVPCWVDAASARQARSLSGPGVPLRTTSTTY